MSATNANRVGHLWASQNTPFGSQGIELWEPNIYIWVLSFQSVYNSSNLQRLLQVSKFLLMYSFTHTKIVFLFRHLPPEIVIFINVCYQMKCFSDDSFFFFFREPTFPTYFFHFMWSSNKVFKDIKIFWTVHSRPFIRYQGKKLDLFCMSCSFLIFRVLFWFHARFKQGIQRH